MGGSIRAISRLIIAKTDFPIKALHSFTYEVKDNQVLFQNLINATTHKELKQLNVRKDRYDTICSGTFIFDTILKYLNIQKVITSGVGVREGLYLSDLLRTSSLKFPSNFNVSVRSLLDRFVDDSKQTAYLGNNISKIFDTLKPLHQLDNKYKSPLIIAAKLQQIGISLNFYKSTTHSANFILDALSYGFSNCDKVLISKIIRYAKKELPQQEDINKFEALLPDLLTVQWLTYINSLNKTLNSEFLRYQYEYALEGNRFIIKSSNEHYIIQRGLNKLKHPLDFEQILLKVNK
jgi:exopolyphosphatase/guanosine-5'-triphosphate,3'-diphosphate pyrophosphatase